jgi:hypothetical protein
MVRAMLSTPPSGKMTCGCGSVVGHIMIGLVMGGASRHVVAAAAAAVVRGSVALGRADDPLLGLPADDPEVTREVNECFQAVAEPSYMHVVAGALVHSAQGLVSRDVQVRANAANHEFQHPR